MRAFVGSKLLLFLGARMVILRRDNTPGIVWPGMLDFPGGGREGDESPVVCALRETREEIGLTLRPEDLRLAHLRQSGARRSWFFAAHLAPEREAEIVFGDEGAGWEMMAPADYLAAPKGIPHFKTILANYEKCRMGRTHPAR